MLKTLKPVEPKLIRLCRSKEWEEVAHRCDTHPKEAKPSTLALKGASTTALAIAVRSGAPIEAIRGLVKANVDQLVVFHKFSGSVLHEALKHRAPYNVLRYLLDAVIQHEQLCHESDKSLFARQDQQGRTVLHNMVARTMRELETQDGDCEGMWLLFQSLVTACPGALESTDTDGCTPLVLALLIPGFDHSIQSKKDERYVHRMVELMINNSRDVVTIAQRGSNPCHWMLPPERKPGNPTTFGSGAPTPLTYAILYKRSDDTVRLLLEANRRIGINCCRQLASGYNEVPLHLAVTMGSSITLLESLIEYDPDSIRIKDMHDLTPLDWVWIRHVLDWNSFALSSTRRPNELILVPSAAIMASSRRHVSSHFTGWYDRTWKDMNAGDTQDTTEILNTLLERMRLFLPAAASVMVSTRNGPGVYMFVPSAKDSKDAQVVNWTLLHSACAVPCPLQVVRLACSEDSSSLKTLDTFLGRLPLHYAAARGGYRISVPLGIAREARTMTEQSPVMDVAETFLEATRVVDNHYQLPLHIAIDTAKKTPSDDNVEAVVELLRLYPDALERRDGKSMLYPFLQAATGEDAHLGLTFVLLRKNPAFVACGRHGSKLVNTE